MAPVVIEEISVEQLRELESAGIALSETGVERLRASEQAAVDAERASAERRADAIASYEEIRDAYLEARNRVLSTTEAFVAARENAAQLRAQYEASWRSIESAGAIEDVGTRVEPGGYERPLSDRFQAVVSGGRW